MKTGKSLLEYLAERNMLPYPGGQVREIYIRISREVDPYLLNILNKIADTTDVDIINLLETEYTNYKNRKI